MSIPVSKANASIFHVETLPRGASRHKQQIRVCEQVNELVAEGRIQEAKEVYRKAKESGVFKVSHKLATRIREEEVRANQIFIDCVVRALKHS